MICGPFGAIAGQGRRDPWVYLGCEGLKFEDRMEVFTVELLLDFLNRWFFFL